jgi:energy-coupling factor transport system permease protein
VSSYLQRRNPALKLAALLVVFFALTLVFDPATPAAFLLIAFVAGWALGGVTPRQILRVLLPFSVAVLGIFLANALFNRLNGSSPALFYAGPLKVTAPALTAAASLSFRVLAFAAFSLVFVKTTDASDLILSLVHQCHLHYRLAYGTLVGYRMLPLLQGEYETIRAAHRVRGVQEREGRFATWGRVRRYAVPLLAGSVRRANRVALAMDARAFGAFPQRSYRRRMVVTAGDWWFLTGVAALAIAVIALLNVVGLGRFGLGV